MFKNYFDLLKNYTTFAAKKEERRGRMSPYLLFMANKEIVKDLTNRALSEDEFFVECTVCKDNKISVFVDGFNNFGIDQCKRISRFIESGLERDKEDFELTVSTPGLDKDFKVHEQYIKRE